MRALGAVALSPINQRRLKNFPANRRGAWSLWIFLAAVRSDAVLRSHRQRPAARRRPTRANCCFRFVVDYPETKFGGFLAITNYPRSRSSPTRSGQWLDDLAADPLSPTTRSTTCLPAAAPSPPSWTAGHGDDPLRRYRPAARRPQLQSRQLPLARHRRSGPRRAGAPDLRLPHLGAVRADPDGALFDRRAYCRRGAGLFRRLGRPARSSASSKSGPRSPRSICC